MANPYHDSNGKFCSQGEMFREVKALSQGSDFMGYFNLRKAYDEIEQSNVSSETELKIRDDYNPAKLNVGSLESSLQSYELVKDALGDAMQDHYTTSGLLSSRFLSEEIRADIIARSTAFGLQNVFERQMPLSPADYRNILNRSDAESKLYPLIAKTRTISFEERASYLKGSAYGTALLAMHNPKEFYGNKELTNLLRNDEFLSQKELIESGRATTDSDGVKQSTVYALASSPHTTDQHAVINSKELNSSYPTPAMALSRNPNLHISSARILLRDEIEGETGYASTIAYELTNNPSLASTFPAAPKERVSYSGPQVTESQKADIRKEIAALKPAAEESFLSPEARRSSLLEGKLYANDADFKAGIRELKSLDKKRKPTAAEQDWQQELFNSIRSAHGVRNAYALLQRIE